ncbi:MAG: galactose-6-phosphate isomerase subunit LacA [Erysipelotrichaceae bacterium]|nr:galactose-6-phosphate isomerase subunit LacA [Erysipelotrichaceae bacterium]
MMFILGSDHDGAHLKEIVKQDLLDHSFDVLDVTENTECDFVDAALNVIREVQRGEDRFGIIIDAYGAGPFMTACKIKGIIAAEVSDERSAYMTRSHNNAKIITLGAKITGPELAKNIVRGFANGSYDGGRHQIRVDMLNKMGRPLPDTKEENA